MSYEPQKLIISASDWAAFSGWCQINQRAATFEDYADWRRHLSEQTPQDRRFLRTLHIASDSLIPLKGLE